MKEVDKIWERVIKLGEEASQKMYLTSTREYVGGMEYIHFELDGKKYKAKINAFWEKTNHFDCYVDGIDNSYKKNKYCNEF